MGVLAVAVVIAGYVALSSSRGSVWPAAALPGGNVLLVTLDTVRADRVMSTSDSPLTPTIGKLMRDGRAFTNAYTHAALTLPAHASILTGLLPPAHGVRGNGSFRLSETHVTLAERLGAAGYQTAAFVGAFVLDARFGLQQGFDRYDGVTDERSFAQDFAFVERRADRVLAAAEQWIVSAAPDSSRPWFAWVHLFDAHAPYDAPASLVRDPYENEIAYVDRELGGLLERLQARGALDRTLIVVTSDHGEGLGEHGESTHGLFAYDSTMRVPLVFHAPGIGSGVHDNLSTHVDILPTVLDIVGVGIGEGLPGRALRLALADPGARRDAYLEAMDGWLTAGAAPLTALVAGSWKFVDAPERELYDLATDPKEERNRFAAEPERANGMARLLRPLAQATSAAPLVRRDEEAEARLRSLGYVSSSPASATTKFLAADDPKSVLPLYERFLKVLAAPERGAVDELLAIVRARPSFVAARLTAASLLINGGQGADAVALLEEARRPEAPLALRERLGAALLAAGRADEAEEVLAEATGHQDASADAWNALGVARASRGKLEEATAAFDQAVTLAPDAARFLFNRALAHLAAGNQARANADLAALTTRHPQFEDGWRALADTRFRHGDRAGAVEAWQRVVALAPADLDSLFNLAVTLHDLGRTEDARRATAAFIARASPEQYRKEIAVLEEFGRIKN